MNILSALAGLASATGTETSARGAARDASPDAAGAGLFAALLGRREGQEGSGDLPAPKAASGTSRETAQETADGGLEALLAEAQAALEDPKLADAELAEALVPLVAALAEVVLPPAAPGIEAGPPVPAGRRLAEALQALRAPSAPVVEAAARTGPTEVRTEVSRLISEISAQVAETPQAQAEPPLRGDRAVSQIPAGGATEMRQMAERPPVDLAPSRVELRAGVAAVPAPPAAAGAELRVPVIADMAAAPAPAPAQPGTVFTPAPPPEVVAQQARAPLPDSGQILGQLRAQVDQGGTIRVALRPEGLGRVEISLAPGDDGQISVTVRADQASVLGSLRADREGLLTLLRDAGHQVEARGLSFADMGSQGSGEGARQNTGQGARQTALPQTWAGETAAEPTDPPTPAAPASGGVDITV
ncbi:flagellar hook-length control protein FliK [Marinovum algicola]|uniref:flagellar hook-length control protein FliK n=1 Tax=Marinovum algicola TaxID=42444 RepID=UPI0024B98930|nr:flagellar hook-length control protein FliK [Marinovum algicola]